ncbi:MAG: MBOAT family O-acyltransferase [Anaerolineae bacterium]|nr:hypothetical protein [Thermoflexales bacterium]MDW8408383.1 MBOAT family O-acyltransferase [Anaerolineae bacterium]
MLSADVIASYVLALAQALVPLRVLLAIGLGALIYSLAPAGARRTVLILISVAIVLVAYQRPPLLLGGVLLVALAVYGAIKLGWPSAVIVAGLVALYAVLHGLIGLLTFTDLLQWTGLSTPLVLPTIGLTVAFTFLRLVHFAVDFGNRRLQSAAPAYQPALFTYLAWCLFFPTFVHLPLIRYPAWAQQFAHLSCERPFAQVWADARAGLPRIAQALIKGALAGVLLVALNPNAVLLRLPHVPPHEFALAAVLSAVAYYVGFSGYTDLGIGAARLFGISLPENFAPLTVFLRIQRMRDFWRNWNITMTRWMNDYIFQPLGGPLRHPLRNVMLTMIGCGLWHSVSLFGVLWGAGLGALLLIEHLWNRTRIRRNWPDAPAWIRQPLLLIGLSLINVSLTPYAYDPHIGRFLYPIFWLERMIQPGS